VDGGRSSTLGRTGSWGDGGSGGSSPDIVVKATGARGDGVVALLSPLLYPRMVATSTAMPAVATSTTTPAATRCIKNRANKGLQDQDEIS
jgi:hypothetical protein